MKGKPGFDKFMEAIEFEYPELFKEITGREPRPNPDKGTFTHTNKHTHTQTHTHTHLHTHTRLHTQIQTYL